MNDSLTPTPRGWVACVNGTYPTLQPAEEPKPPEDHAEPPDPEDGRSTADAAPEEAHEEPAVPENPVPRQVADWVNRHWDLVKAMACAEETPQRPPPPPEVAEVFAQPAPAEPPPQPPVHVARGDRWNKPKMGEFLRQLAATHSVTAAARAVGMSRKSAYKLRARLKGQPFDIAWEAAFRHGYDELAHAALELALEGEEVPHYHQGELKGTHRKRNPNLMIQLLRMRNREGVPMLGRYGAAAEYWSENWDRLVHRVETGAVTWDYELGALSDEERNKLGLPDEREKIEQIILRHSPDDPPGRFGK